MSAITPAQGKTYSSVRELAAELNLSTNIVYRGLRTGQIPHIRIGKRFVLPRAAIQHWLESAGAVALRQTA